MFGKVRVLDCRYRYIDRLESYFKANELKEVNTKWAIILSVCDNTFYRLTMDLIAPLKPLVQQVKPNIIV